MVVKTTACLRARLCSRRPAQGPDATFGLSTPFSLCGAVRLRRVVDQFEQVAGGHGRAGLSQRGGPGGPPTLRALRRTPGQHDPVALTAQVLGARSFPVAVRWG